MRSTFDKITADLVERTMEPVKQAMADARPARTTSTRSFSSAARRASRPAVYLVRRLTGGKDPNMSVNPDEVVALGAAIQAGVLKGEVKDVLLLDVTPLSLGVETRGGAITKIIDRNTTIPVRRSETFSTAEDNQEAVDIVVLQGEREMAADNRILGRFQLKDIRPAPRGEPQVEVIFDIDANGIVNVTARDKDTGKEQTITISEGSNLDQGRGRADGPGGRAAPRRMEALRDAVDADELDAVAYQVERRLNELGDAVPSHERAWADMLVADAREAVQQEASPDKARPRLRTPAGAGVARPVPGRRRRTGPGRNRNRDGRTPRAPRRQPATT